MSEFRSESVLLERYKVESQDSDVIKTGVEGKQDSTVPFPPKMCFPEFTGV